MKSYPRRVPMYETACTTLWLSDILSNFDNNFE